jgi:hypothetical protein
MRTYRFVLRRANVSRSALWYNLSLNSPTAKQFYFGCEAKVISGAAAKSRYGFDTRQR